MLQESFSFTIKNHFTLDLALIVFNCFTYSSFAISEINNKAQVCIPIPEMPPVNRASKT